MSVWIFGVGQLMADLTWAAQDAVPTGENALQSVAWGLYPEGCPSPTNGRLVACGDYGTFSFGSGSTGCAEVTGIESPPMYSTPGPQMAQLPGGPIPRSFGEILPPCVDGTCFEAAGGASGNEPWIAVIDWDTQHGWTTGWSAISMSGLPAHLYALDGDDLTAFLGPIVTDAHLLARLCGVTEAIDRQEKAVPKVVSMSFGRYFASGIDADFGTTCDAANLSCQIGRVIDYLTNAGTVITAAAGNYGAVQFPAAYDAVLATGSLDLAQLAWTKKVAAAWETPSRAEVLVPGYGICLENTDPEGRTELWAAPPGSSYANGIFAGWLAHTLHGWPVFDLQSVSWGLSWSEAEDCFVLSEEGPAVCNPAADRMLSRVLGGTSNTCWTSSPEILVEVDSLGGPVRQGITLQLPSLEEYVELGHTTSPDSEPCVPCVSDGGFHQSVRSDPKGPQMRGLDSDLVLDLSVSSAIRPFLTLQELHLRVADDFYPLLIRTDPEHVAKLETLADGEADGLMIRNARRLFSPDQQPSLLFVLCDQAADCFWSSIPVLSFE